MGTGAQRQLYKTGTYDAGIPTRSYVPAKLMFWPFEYPNLDTSGSDRVLQLGWFEYSAAILFSQRRLTKAVDTPSFTYG